MASKPGPRSGHQWRPDSWPRWRKEANKILLAEGPQEMMALVPRLTHLVPPDRALRHAQKDARYMKTETFRRDQDELTLAGQRDLVLGTLHSGIQTGFYRRWLSDDDVTIIDLGPSGRRYFEEKNAQGDQPAQVQRTGEGTEGTDGSHPA